MIPVTMARIASIGIGDKGALAPVGVVAEVLISGADVSGGTCGIGASGAVLPIVLYGTTLLSDNIC